MLWFYKGFFAGQFFFSREQILSLDITVRKSLRLGQERVPHITPVKPQLVFLHFEFFNNRKLTEYNLPCFIIENNQKAVGTNNKSRD